jgi:RNA polymerase sigma factor (sigma-70 family)
MVEVVANAKLVTWQYPEVAVLQQEHIMTAEMSGPPRAAMRDDEEGRHMPLRPLSRELPPVTAGPGPTRQCLATRVPRIENFLRRRGFSEAVVACAVDRTIRIAESYLDTGRAHRLQHRVAWLYAVARREAAKAALLQPTFFSLDRTHLELLQRRRGEDAEERQQAVRQAVEAALRRLTVKQRRAVELHFLQGNSLREAARLLGVSPGSLAGRLSLARKSLAKILRPDGAGLRQKASGSASARPSK